MMMTMNCLLFVEILLQGVCRIGPGYQKSQNDWVSASDCKQRRQVLLRLKIQDTGLRTETNKIIVILRMLQHNVFQRIATAISLAKLNNFQVS